MSTQENWFGASPLHPGNTVPAPPLELEPYRLVPVSDPILREVMPRFDFTNPPMDPVELATKLKDAMKQFGGLGLSACQIGLPYRAFAIRTNPVAVVFNPILVDIGEETVALDEGCLSVPGLFLKIERPRRVKLRFADETGTVHTQKYEGITARCILHEMDHMNGKLFYDHVSKLKLDLAMKKANKQGYNYKRSDLFFRKEAA